MNVYERYNELTLAAQNISDYLGFMRTAWDNFFVEDVTGFLADIDDKLYAIKDLSKDFSALRGQLTNNTSKWCYQVRRDIGEQLADLTCLSGGFAQLSNEVKAEMMESMQCTFHSCV